MFCVEYFFIFMGLLLKMEEMKVYFFGFIFVNILMVFIDFLVFFVNCSFV